MHEQSRVIVGSGHVDDINKVEQKVVALFCLLSTDSLILQICNYMWCSYECKKHSLLHRSPTPSHPREYFLQVRTHLRWTLDNIPT